MSERHVLAIGHRKATCHLFVVHTSLLCTFHGSNRVTTLSLPEHPLLLQSSTTATLYTQRVNVAQKLHQPVSLQSIASACDTAIQNKAEAELCVRGARYVQVVYGVLTAHDVADVSGAVMTDVHFSGSRSLWNLL